MGILPVQRIPFVDLHRQHTAIAGELQDAFQRVLATSAFTLGEEVERFEAEFAGYCGVDHCVGVASGTAALTIALRAAGIGRGDEVIVPAHTFIASALAVLHSGAEVVFCDVDRGTGLIDVAAAADVVGPRTAAIIPVHLYGQPCQMNAVMALARRHGLLVLEDVAQAHGARVGSRMAGAVGTAGCFSFYPSKNLGALGDGGAICTTSAELAGRARELRNLGQRQKGHHVTAGYNERLDGLQAAMLRVKLRHLDRWNARRREHAEAYRALLGDHLRLLEERPQSTPVYHLFPVRVQMREAFRAQLSGFGIETGVHYAPAVPEQPPFQDRVWRSYPQAEAWAEQEVSLPMFAELEPQEIEYVAEACLSALTGGGEPDGWRGRMVAAPSPRG